MRKFILFIPLLIGIAIGAFFIGKNITSEKDRSIHEHEIQLKYAILEIEESIFGASGALFYYMVHPSRTSLESYKHHLEEIDEYVIACRQLSETDEEQLVIQKFANHWQKVVTKAEALLRARDEFQKTQEKAWDMIHEVDDILDYKFQPAFVPGSPDLLKKEQTVREIEVSIWEAINAANYYAYHQFDKSRREYDGQLADVQEYWNVYRNLQLTSSEKSHVAEFEASWQKAVGLMNKLNKDAETITDAQSVFWEDMHRAEAILDFEIKAALTREIFQ